MDCSSGKMTHIEKRYSEFEAIHKQVWESTRLLDSNLGRRSNQGYSTTNSKGNGLFLMMIKRGF